MKKQFVALVTRTLLILFVSCGLAEAEDTPQLLKIKHSILSPTSEQIVLQLNGSYSPKIFTLKDEKPRVVFDFAAMTPAKDVKNTTTPDGSIVKRIRVGTHGDDAPKTRVVFDVTTLKGVTYTQHFDEQSSSLVIRFTGPEKSATPRKQEAQAEPAPKAVEKAGKEPTKTPVAATPDTVASEPAAVPAPPAEQPAAATQAATPTPPPPPAAEPVAAPQPKPAMSEEQPAPVAQKETAAPQVASKKTEQPAPQPASSTKPEPAPAKPEASAPTKTEKPAETKAAAPPAEAKKEAPPAAETADKKSPQPEATAPPQTSKADGEQTADKAKAAPTKPSTPLKTADNPQLESIKFDPSSPKGEMVLFKLNGFHPPSVHGVEEGIPRVICDFNNTKLVDGNKNLIKTDGKFVKVIRTSKTKKPEKVRVVIDLEPNRSYDLQQVFFKEDNLFVLIVNTVKK